MLKIKIPFYLQFLLRILMPAVLVLTLLRLVLIWYIADPAIRFTQGSTWKAMEIGLQFDLVVMAYVLAIPLLLLFIQSSLLKRNTLIPGFLIVYFTLTLPLVLFTGIADIPYFKFFHNRLTESSLQWMNSPDMVLGMIMANTENLYFLLGAFALCIYLSFVSYRWSKKMLINHPFEKEAQSLSNGKQATFFIIALLLCFMGLRGKIDRPIRQGDAFFGSHPLLNQIGLNPVFTFIKSYTDKVNLMDNESALSQTKKYLQIPENTNSASPLSRSVQANGKNIPCNVVLVLMESMSAKYLDTFGNGKHLTPTLDSLIAVSWFFNQGYSAGIHTNNGVFSTLYSFPALKRIRPMSMVPARKYTGLPYVLKQAGYQNLFFSSHDETFDNLGTFIPANHFDHLYSAKDYPADKMVGVFGVADDYLFQFASDKLDACNPNQPFFASILTTSNHDPYTLPDYFRSNFESKDERAVNYADWSIQQFLNRAKKSKWYANTLFIFIADHGLVVGENPYDLPLSYHHIPMIFHGPGILGEAKTFHQYMGQIDVFPTLMGMLQYSYINNTMGTDVLKSPRPAIYFSADNKIGCLNEEWLYVFRFGGSGSLYHYKNSDSHDYIDEQKEIATVLRDYAFSQIQTADYIFNKDLAGPTQ